MINNNMKVETMNIPNFNNLRRYSNFSTIEFHKNFAVKSNLGNLLKEDIDLLSKESMFKNYKLPIIDDIEEEKNDKFYNDFLNTLHDDNLNENVKNCI